MVQNLSDNGSRMPSPLPASILVVDDDLSVAQVLCALLGQAGFQAAVVNTAADALKAMAKKPYDAVLTDVRMPGMTGLELLHELKRLYADIPVVLISAHGTLDDVVKALRLGAADFIQKPFEREEIAFVMKKVTQAALPSLSDLPPTVRRQPTSEALRAIVGETPAVVAMRQLIQKVAPTSATVLIRGESGTGKELVANAIHAGSPRSNGPLVRLNCGSLPDNLLESELFGYEKGAFTGAVQRKPGRVELADGGTLFLDEIGDVTPAMQVKLLRLIQERQFERLGGTETLRVDLRFVAATHQPLEQMVREGTFREDLFYRLNVVPLHTPALRDRAQDIVTLTQHFVAVLCETHARTVRCDDSAFRALERQPWPGNIRQLHNVLERLIILSDSEVVTSVDVERECAEVGGVRVGLAFAEPLGVAVTTSANPFALDVARQQQERLAIAAALSKAEGNRSVAARLLGISRRTLYNKLEALAIE